MKLTQECHDRLTVLALSGEFTADDAEAFRRAAEGRLSDRTRDFVLDARELQFIDSQGLEALLWLQDRCADQLGQVRLAAPSDTVRQILELTRLAPRFECHADLESALKSLRM